MIASRVPGIGALVGRTAAELGHAPHDRVAAELAERPTRRAPAAACRGGQRREHVRAADADSVNALRLI